MGFLRDFERRIEGAVEGLFARAFRSGVQPVELGKRLVRAVEDSRQVGVSRVYVDNLYSIELSPRDRQRFADYERALTSELAALVVDTARENDWAMMGPARVELETDEALSEGRFRVVSRVEANEQPVPAARGWAQEPAGPVGPATAMLPGEVRSTRPRAPASLTLLLATGAVSRVYPLGQSEVMIGRSEQSDIALADPGVSRNHARIIREGDDFIVEDLRSTNGTEVNGQPIRRRRLADGDVVKLANSTLQFRREG
jgi:FhaA, N-terminal domain/FHA domain